MKTYLGGFSLDSHKFPNACDMILDRFYCGDSRELLSELDTESIDLIITDVPYLTTSRGGCGTMGGYWKGEKAMKGKIFDHNNTLIEEYIDDLYRVLKERTHCYIMVNNLNLPHFLEVIGKTKFKFIKSVIWDKCSKIAGHYYMSCYEHILLLRKGGDKQINECGTPDILKVPIGTKPTFPDGTFINPTAKPVALYEILIRNSSNIGDLVLDPFSGSGTIGRACKRLNRHFIGFDIDKRQVDYANQNLDMKQLTIF